MQTVVEMVEFVKACKASGIGDDERAAIVDLVSDNPAAGDEIQGTGGARKVRIAGQGRGKSGGYRVITFFTGADIPVFLLSVYAKGKKDDFTQDQRNQLRKRLAAITADYRRRNNV